MRLSALLVAAVLGCAAEADDGAFGGRYDRDQLARALTDDALEPGLLLGEFTLQNKGIVDGDTIKVEGLDASMRLLGLDCEETFKSDKALRAYEVGFDEYLKNEQAKTDHPVKIPTPLGMDAKHFAEDFFKDVTKVRLERDHPRDIRDRYNRYLAYAFAKKGGKWVNYNVECVRAGMSPYFTKYGQSTRFHAEFVAAQNEARAAERGIWNPATEHYRDYPVRLAWWDLRGEFVAEFQREAKTKPNFVTLTHWDSLTRLAHFEGDEVVLLGNVGDIRPGKNGGPTRVMLARRMFDDFTLVFFDDQVLDASKIEHAKGEFVRVIGTVTKYKFKGKGKGKRGRGEEQLQIVVKDPRQIQFVDTWALAKSRVPLAPGEGDPTIPEPEPEVAPSEVDREPDAPIATPPATDPPEPSTGPSVPSRAPPTSPAVPTVPQPPPG